MKDILMVVTMIVCPLVLLVKDQITLRCRLRIIDAIYLYRIDMRKRWLEPLVTYSDMESYDSTVFRIWDWGYTRILPPDKYEIIKKFI